MASSLGPREFHPYHQGVKYIPGSRLMVIGTFPTVQFSNKDFRKKLLQNRKNVDFFYGGSSNRLWSILTQAFAEELRTAEAREKFLETRKISMADLIISCRRVGQKSTDDCLCEIHWNDHLREIIEAKPIHRLLFTSQTAEKWFAANIDPHGKFRGEKIILPSPSGLAWSTVKRSKKFQRWLDLHPGASASDYYIQHYLEAFSL